METEYTTLTPWFLSSSSEYDELFEALWLELIGDNVKWRKSIQNLEALKSNVHKDSNPALKPVFDAMKLQIEHLSNELKKSKPPYKSINLSNNDTEITMNLELEAGQQIARMLGFNTDQSLQPCAWGHIESGENTANYNSLWNARAVSCYPLALKAAAEKLNLKLTINTTSKKLITQCSSWECQNFNVDEVITLCEGLFEQLYSQFDQQTAENYFTQVNLQRVEHMGMASFFAEHWEAKQPLILVPSTAFAAWEKSLKLLGFGSNQLIKLEVDQNMHTDIDSLERLLVNAEIKKIPVLILVGILGTPEFGSIDPIGNFVDLRNRFKNKGLNFYLHIDASWGGYLCGLFRKENGQLCSYEEMQNQYSNFPSLNTYEAFKIINEVDSVTVVPHMMGYLPFGTGAYINRNREIALLSMNDNFVANKNNTVNERRDHLDQYIDDCTTSDIIGIACCLTHSILPLNNNHLGRILSESLRLTEYFHNRLKKTIDRLKQQVTIILPLEPDSNVLCLAINPVNNLKLGRMNRFTQRVYKKLNANLSKPLENKAFFCSISSLQYCNMGNENTKRLLENLGIDNKTFVINDGVSDRQTDHIKILRHTLVNPWLLSNNDGENHIDNYCDLIEKTIFDVVNKESSAALIAINTR